MFFCEFCEISKKTFFYRTPVVAASLACTNKYLTKIFINLNPLKSRYAKYARTRVFDVPNGILAKFTQCHENVLKGSHNDFNYDLVFEYNVKILRMFL